MADPEKKARGRLSVEEFIAYGTALVAGAGLFITQSGILGNDMENKSPVETPAITEIDSAAGHPPVTMAEPHDRRAKDDIVVATPLPTPGTAEEGTPDIPAALDIVPQDGPGAMANSPELPHVRIMLEFANAVTGIPIPPEMPAEMRAERNHLARMSAKLKKLGLETPPYEVASAIHYGAKWTGADELYLNVLARAESTYRHSIHNESGGGKGACGLFQFRTASTYLAQIYKHAPKFPPAYQWMNGTIQQGVNRRGETVYRIRPGADEGAIYESCYDPKFSSVLAGFMSLDDRAALEDNVNMRRDPNFTDMYSAHLIGLGGGSRFLRAHEANPNRNISRYVSERQRRANPNLFSGTLRAFYEFLAEDKGMSTTTYKPSRGLFLTELPAANDALLPENVPLPTPRPKREHEIPMGLRR